MRKLLFLLSLLVSTACTSEKTELTNDLTISPTEFTNRETSLLNGLIGQEVLGYDVSNIPIGHKLHILVEHYHDGSKRDNVVEFADIIQEDHGVESIIITKEKQEENFTFKVLTLYNNGVNLMDAKGAYKEVNSSSLFSKLEEEVSFNINEEVVIGMTIEDNGNEISSGTLQEEDPRFQEIIKTYQDVFIYKIYVSED